MVDNEYAFELDVCATAENKKCKKYYSEGGLEKEWKGRCWMNPPYGKEIKLWMKKAYETALSGYLVVCLVPARTDTIWWHEYATKGDIWFIPGRLKFEGAKNSAPFPSALITLRPSVLNYRKKPSASLLNIFV